MDIIKNTITKIPQWGVYVFIMSAYRCPAALFRVGIDERIVVFSWSCRII